MPFYTVITKEGDLSAEHRAEIASEITRIHVAVMKIPLNYVRVVFLPYQDGDGFAGGQANATAALTCILRTGHSAADKSELLKQLWAMFQKKANIQSDELAIALNEVPAENAMEMGEVMPAV